MSVWRLFVATPGCDWQPVDAFDDVAAAADRIRQMEGYPATGIFLEFYIDSLSSDFEALSHFEHTGQRNRYVIRHAIAPCPGQTFRKISYHTETIGGFLRLTDPAGRSTLRSGRLRPRGRKREWAKTGRIQTRTIKQRVLSVRNEGASVLAKIAAVRHVDS